MIPKQRKIKAWAVFNCKRQFIEVHRLDMETSAQVLIEELTESWGKKGAYYHLCEIVLLPKVMREATTLPTKKKKR